MADDSNRAKSVLNDERLAVLEQVEEWLDVPMLVLGFAWLLLFVVEVIWGLGRLLQTVSNVIWAIFVIDFLIRFTLAPFKLRYLKSNWLTAISLVVPALRLLRIARLAQILRLTRVTRGLRLLRTVSSLNRGMRALGATMRRRGFAYVLLLTLIMVLVGAAGMLAFEGGIEGQQGQQGIHTYGDALWWTAMAMTTMGSDYFPVTAEGRVLGFIIALYAFAVFGYVTATLATFFVGRDAQNEEAEIPNAGELKAVQQELAHLRTEVRLLIERLDSRAES
ncbi:MAG: ion transporter [Chloroflexota bacterium]